MNRLIPLALLMSLPAIAADEIGKTHKIGIGLGGTNMAQGFTGKLYLSPTTAVQGVLGQYGMYGTTSGTSMSVDFLQEIGSLAEVDDTGRLFWGVGAGAGLILFGNSQTMGISGVVELGWHFEQFPLEITTDWRPTLYFGDAYLTGMYYRGGGAIRYFF